ncbi:hypothetical protein HB662_11955 [Roseomonas frigidaquae]|uniref:Mandelate racemase/muconate lactonizing enzyme C-terminal domain-containing protein n=1 Tax=Falsiroseomonas frigidaquae TaxID=487318 RepID=A0ABX1EZL4_9PROT|nr:enolase C-terminal domain-like protein [Falsiroseomonas frigidaquae]NKE45493.1 hypothetical protein [Falsiroseomonas frigidaquae]
MRIASIETLPCVQRQEDPSWNFARGAIPNVRGWIIRVRDTDGAEGFGYGHAMALVTGLPEALPHAVAHYEKLLKDRPLADLAAHAEAMGAALVHAPGARAGVEMALHDLLARRLSIPVGTLFGGRFRDRIPCARLLALKPPEGMAEKAAALVAEGYRALKVKFSGDPALDAARLAAIRAAVGPAVRLSLDPNQAYSAKGFLQLFERICVHDIALVEQPVPASDWDGLALLTARLGVPVEADESAASLTDVARLARTRMVDVMNLKPTKIGGIRDTLAAIAICEAAGIGVRFGASFGPGLLQAFTSHLAASLKHLEHSSELAEHAHLLDDPFAPYPVVDGSVAVPDAPGTGLDLIAP